MTSNLLRGVTSRTRCFRQFPTTSNDANKKAEVKMKKTKVTKMLGCKGVRAARGKENGSIQLLMRIDPDAQEVFVAGSFNNWNPCTTPLMNIGHGRWVKDLSLAPGRYEYQFVVDGRWMPDLQAE